MAETSKNKIYYNDDENSVADVLTDMKKMAESTDKAIENSKYDDAQIKKDISDAKKEQVLKDAEQDNKIIELQNEKAELEKELKEAQEDFYQNSIRGQASGEYIHVEDSSNCRARIGIGGNSEQETRSGKNLSKIEKISTINGGYINSTCGILATIEAGKTYTISFNCSNKHSGTNAIYVRALNENTYEGQAVLNYSSGNRISKTFVASKSGELSLSASLNTDFEDILYDIQLEEGSTATKYEQYGAMPSKNYPSEIKTVGSNVNIFDKDNMTIGKIWSGATLLDSDVGNASPKIPVTAGKTYIRNAGYSSNYIIKEDNSVVDIQGGTNAITMPEDSKYWMFNIPKDIDINTIKAEEGSISTPQSKYGQGCITEVICNSILDNVTMEQGAFSANVGKDYTSTKVDSSTRIRTTNLIKLDVSKTYTMNFNTKYNVVIQAFNDSKQLYSVSDNIANVWHLNSFSFSGYPYIAIAVKNNDNTSVITSAEIDNINLILSDKIQTYIMPTQSEMLKGDYFDYDNEEEVHIWNKLVLDGNEKYWEVQNSGNRFYLNSSLLKSAIFPNNVVGEIYCTHFKRKTANNTWNGIEGISYANQTIAISCRSIATDVSTFIEYLKSQYDAETPVIVYYKLQTPTRLKFTDEQKAVAKELNNARTYKNITNIITDSKAILSLDYAKDLETLLNNTQALAVNNASEGV